MSRLVQCNVNVVVGGSGVGGEWQCTLVGGMRRHTLRSQQAVEHHTMVADSNHRSWRAVE